MQKTADDLKAFPPRRYGFEEWVEYARLIRFTMKGREELDNAEEDALIEWELLAEQKESGWLFGKLTESLVRYLRKQELEHVAKRQSTEIWV
jgi:potassium channel subfamily K, other eukaryote